MYSRVCLLAPVLGLALVVGTGVSAEAASPSIRPIKAATAEYQGSVRIKPSYLVPSGAQVSKARLTVKKGSKTVARNKASAALKAGKYRVTQTLTYRTFSFATRSVRVVAAGTWLSKSAWYDDPVGPYFESCTYTAVESGGGTLTVKCPVHRMVNEYDAKSLGSYTFRGTFTQDDYGFFADIAVAGQTFRDVLLPEVGDTLDELESFVAPSALYESQKYRSYSGVKTKKRSQVLTIRQHPKPRGCSKPSDIRKVRNGMSVTTVRRIMQNKGKVTFSSGGYVLREYKTCDKYDYMTVSFEGGFVYGKTLMDW